MKVCSNDIKRATDGGDDRPLTTWTATLPLSCLAIHEATGAFFWVERTDVEAKQHSGFEILVHGMLWGQSAYHLFFQTDSNPRLIKPYVLTLNHLDGFTETWALKKPTKNPSLGCFILGFDIAWSHHIFSNAWRLEDDKLLTPPKFNSSPLKHHGWKMILSF